ncbi:MAG TPA: malonyl-CoA decarboxylase N-terminal domain-containing protein, partial [Acetobacteraceae bacterium]|nr:malonyl-CoA decarboxylase N-terminal domain-containing protein [Acetobacteraceae bacterium]
MSETTAPIGLFDRAIRRIATVWRDMASTVTVDEEEGIIGQMRACLSARGGEISARNRAAKLAQTYLGLDDPGRRAFLQDLASFDSDKAAVDRAYDTVQSAPADSDRATALVALRQALEPPRVKLLTQFTTIPDGMKFLVDLRATLLDLKGTDPYLGALESDLRGLL